MAEESVGGKLLARAAGLISAATMLSRLLGLLREQLFAALFGAGAMADAFNVAFRIPNLLRDLFAEGALSQAFVPTFKGELKNRSAHEAHELGNRVAGTLFVTVGILVLTAAIFAEPIVEVIGRGYTDTERKFELTVLLTRVMLPFLPIVSLAAVAMGMLNAKERYGAPALAPAMFNIASISVGLGLYYGGVSGSWVAIGWAIGTLAGGACQLGVQLPSLFKTGFRPRLRADMRLRDPRVRRIGRLMLPAVVGLAAVQLNIVVNTMFATSEDGAVSWLQYAFRFLQLPIGVFGVAIATVSTTRYADAAADDDREAISRHLVDGLRLVAFLTVPATVGLVILGRPIIAFIFERGAFDFRDTLQTADALRYYAIGLVAYASVKVLAPAYYAVDRARIPVIASVSAVLANLAISITLHPIYGYRILALGTAIAALVNCAVLYLSFGRVIARIDLRRLVVLVAKVTVAAAVMAAGVWLVRDFLYERFPGWPIGERALVALVPVFVGIVIYGGLCWLLRVEELSHYLGRIKRRLKK